MSKDFKALQSNKEKDISAHNASKFTMESSESLCTNLILKHSSTKGPHCSKHEVQFVQLLVTIRWRVGGIQEALQQVTQGGYHGNIRDRRDLFKTHAQCVQTDGHVLVKQDLQVGFL